jgi:hypothetical protein
MSVIQQPQFPYATQDYPMPDKSRPRKKDFHRGYSPVLLRTDLKEQLKQFRKKKGLAQESHFERCLVSAAIDLLINDPALHGRWIDGLAEATSRDVRLAVSGEAL